MPYVNHSKRTPWTRDEVRHKLMTDKTWIEKAIVELYKRQTATEQVTKHTVNHNTIGFQPADAMWFSRFAEYIETQSRRGRKYGEILSPKQMAIVMKPWGRPGAKKPRIAKYSRQILMAIEAAAIEKEGKKPLS